MSAPLLLLVDGDTAPAGDGIVVFWSRSEVADGEYSLPVLVEKVSLESKSDYLAWVHDVGNTPVRGVPLSEFLVFEDLGLSGWWLGLVAEKASVKTSTIYDVFRLRALERLYSQLSARGLVYHGEDRRIHRTLRAWCTSCGHSYRWVRDATGGHRYGVPRVRRFTRRLPYLVQGIGFLLWKVLTRYLPARVCSRFPIPTAESAQALIVTYFPNIDFDKARENIFWSNYWQQLHGLLDTLDITPNWIWMQGHTAECDFRQALSLRERFNTYGRRKERHYLLEDFVTLKVLAKALSSYARLYTHGLALSKVREKFILRDSMINFFPVLEREWKSSLFGTAAMSGMLYHALFDSLLLRLSVQRWCLYMWEGQPWESALLPAWRQHCLGPVIGYQHATVMPLDLRALCDPRTYREVGKTARPLPDVLAVNGSGALDLFRDVKYPEDKLVSVEALRYPHLSKDLSSATVAPSNRPRTLLIIGGYLESETELLLRILNEATELIESAGYARVWVKGHPLGPLRMLHGPVGLKLSHEIVSESLDALWSEIDFALVSNSTSAVVEAVYAGVPVAVCGSEQNLNLSPLFGHPAVPFVLNGSQLGSALASPRCVLLPPDYFLISERPGRWADLLSKAGRTTMSVIEELPPEPGVGPKRQ